MIEPREYDAVDVSNAYEAGLRDGLNTRREHQAALSVTCPGRTCRAQPGEPCVSSAGDVRAETHHLRWLATQQAVTKCCTDGCAVCHWTTFKPSTSSPVAAGA